MNKWRFCFGWAGALLRLWARKKSKMMISCSKDLRQVHLEIAGIDLSGMSLTRKRKASFTVDDDFAVLNPAPRRVRRSQRVRRRPSREQVVAAGPASVQELFRWPDDFLKPITGDAWQRLLDFMHRGLLCSTDYSGMDCPRELMQQLQKALEIPTHEPFHVRFRRSCDIAPGPLRILQHLAIEVDCSESCVFADVEAALTPEAKDALDTLEVETDLGAEDDLYEPDVNVYERIRQHLLEHRESVFGRELSSKCEIHEKHCPVGLELREGDPSTSVRMSWAGTCCTAWSSVGKQKRYNDSDLTMSGPPNAFVWQKAAWKTSSLQRTRRSTQLSAN